MKRVLFATGNSRKVQEAERVLSQYGIEVEAAEVEIDEIQHHDPIEITKAKARAAYVVTKQPVVVADTSWDIPALNGFPGGYMKDLVSWFQPEDWMALMKRHDDRTIYAHEHLAYFDGETVVHFQEDYKGVFVQNPDGVLGNSLEKVVDLYGIGTISSTHDKTGTASSDVRLEYWEQFGAWYKENREKK